MWYGQGLTRNPASRASALQVRPALLLKPRRGCCVQRAGAHGGSWVTTLVSGRSSFWGGAYTLHKWTRNLRTKIQKCVPTKRKRETNDALQKHLHHRGQRYKMLFANDARFPFTIVPSMIVCVLFCLRLVETESRVLRTPYTSLPWFCVQLDFYA